MSCLHNLDKIILKYSCWHGLGTNIRRLDYSTDTEPEAVIDRAKALFETVSKTLLVRLGENRSSIENLDIVGLRQKLLEQLNLKESDEKIIKNLIDILATSRNTDGIIGHGRDLDREAEIRRNVNMDRNDFIISTLDACLCYMINLVETQNQITEVVETDSYSSNDAYNDLLDADQEAIEIRGVAYKKSELLFYADRINYNDGLKEYQNENTNK